jgi:hypothetical protein
MLYELARNLDEIIDALVTLLADQPLIVGRRIRVLSATETTAPRLTMGIRCICRGPRSWALP